MSKQELINERIKILMENFGLEEVVYVMLENEDIEMEILEQLREKELINN